MSRTLLATNCTTAKRDHFWDSTARSEVFIDKPGGAVCTPFSLPQGTLVDSWFEGADKIEIRTTWDGAGRPPRTLTERVVIPNAPGGGETPCGLKIDDVRMVQDGATYTATILTSGYEGEVEYSLNGLADVQASPVFENLSPGAYIAYARAKN